jgi:TrmH family RNA methyltransferase
MVRSGTVLDEDEVLLETPNLVEDALRSGVRITTVLVGSAPSLPIRKLLDQLPESVRRHELGPDLLAQLTSTESAPGILALCEAPRWNEADLFTVQHPLLLVLAGIQDPGNLGAILRSAEAFGASGVLSTKGTVSCFNAKANRAASGTIFRLPFLRNLSPSGIKSLLRKRNVTLLTSEPRGGKSPAEMEEVDLSKPLALALGSEGAGLPRELLELGQPVTIPISARVESLNVACAASVILYEISRQRQFKAKERIS